MKSLQQFFHIVLIIMVPCLVVSCKIDNSSNPAAPSNSNILSFSGYTWGIKSSENLVDPGPNHFSDSPENVWVDGLGQLHLRITQRNGQWYCAEVVSERTFGYGTYHFYLASRVDRLNENAVLGLFTWDNDPADYNNREIDIEFSRWGTPTNDNAQFVVQPYYKPDNIHRFSIQLTGDYSTHSFDWRNDKIFFRSAHDHYAEPPETHVIETWNYTGQDIPSPGNENARINLWLFGGVPPSDDQEVEVVVAKFEFIPFTE